MLLFHSNLEANNMTLLIPSNPPIQNPLTAANRSYPITAAGNVILPYRTASARIASAVVNQARTAIVAAGGTITSYECWGIAEALEPLIRSTAWAKIQDLWFPMGTTLAGAMVKLKWNSVGSTQSCTSAGTVTYNPNLGITGDGSTGYINTGYNQVTAGATVSSMGWGVVGTSATPNGIIGAIAGGLNYIGYTGNTNFIANNTITPTLWVGGLQSVQTSGGQAQFWNGGYLGASVTQVQNAFTNGTLALLNNGGSGQTLFSSNTVAGYATWFPALTAAEMTLLNNFFFQASANISRNLEQGYYVPGGDSITYGVGATTNAYRYSTLVANSLGLPENNQGLSGYALTSGIPLHGQWPVNQGIKQLPTFTTLMLGTNDIIGTNASGSGLVWTTVFANMQAQMTSNVNMWLSMGLDPSRLMIMSAPASPNLVTLNSTPNTTSQAQLAQWDAWLQNFCANAKVGFASGYNATLPYFNTPAAWQGDGIHPTNVAHAALASAVVSAVNSSVVGGPLVMPDQW